MKSIKLLSPLLLLLLTSGSCKVRYTASGAETGTAETISVQYFTNNATLNNPAVSQVFTEKLKTKFIKETNLKLIDNEGDMQVTGRITDYSVTPVAIQQDVSAARNRLTITMSVKFVNLTNSKYDFERTFSNFEDFDANKNLSSEESRLIDLICDKIVQDIFNAAVINW